jgi:NADPH:quinone reductase-like Zn-dependent oxidoreductase
MTKLLHTQTGAAPHWFVYGFLVRTPLLHQRQDEHSSPFLLPSPTAHLQGLTPYQGGVMSHETLPQIPTTMRAFAIDRFGEPGTLRTLPTPTIGADEILVRVHAAGINPLDEKIRDGFKAVAGVRFPFILGQDADGVVVQTGPNVTRFGVGSAVYGVFWLAGTFAEYVRVPALRVAVAHKPTMLDFAQAAALPTPALAAVTALQAVTITTGDTLLIVGATGGVGSYAVQMAARCGARVIATARPDAEAYVRQLGAVEVIDYTQRDLVAAVKAAHPQGIDALIDVISDRTVLPHMTDTLRAGGRLATTIHSADEAALAARGICATNVDVFGTTEGLDEVARFMDAGGITVPLERTFPLEAAADALAAIQAGHLRGKLVLTVA